MLSNEILMLTGIAMMTGLKNDVDDIMTEALDFLDTESDADITTEN